MRWLVRFERAFRPLIHFAHRRLRGATVGVKGLVRDAEGRVLLIEHTYVDGWHLPGGGIERGEAAEVALSRELVEEAGVQLTGRPRLVSVHSNHAYFRGDQVLLYHIDSWEPCTATSRGEISRVAWFKPDDLPEGASAATRARILELQSGAEPGLLW